MATVDFLDVSMAHLCTSTEHVARRPGKAGQNEAFCVITGATQETGQHLRNGNSQRISSITGPSEAVLLLQCVYRDEGHIGCCRTDRHALADAVALPHPPCRLPLSTKTRSTPRNLLQKATNIVKQAIDMDREENWQEAFKVDPLTRSKRCVTIARSADHRCAL